jgi:hypothetical protein
MPGHRCEQIYSRISQLYSQNFSWYNHFNLLRIFLLGAAQTQFRYSMYCVDGNLFLYCTHHTQNVPSGKIFNRISYFGTYQFHQQTLSPTNNFIPPPLWGILRYVVVLSGIAFDLLLLSNLISTSYLFLKARNSSDISSSKHQSTSLLGSKECQPVCYFNCCHEIKLQWSILSSHLFRSSA